MSIDMEPLPLERAQQRFLELQGRLERLRLQVKQRQLAGRLAPDDLERVMELDAAIELAAAYLAALK